MNRAHVACVAAVVLARVASRVEIQLRRADAGVLLMVRDDGVGPTPRANGASHGIRGMRERAMLIGAQLTIDRPPDGGTEVRLLLPQDEATR